MKTGHIITWGKKESGRLGHGTSWNSEPGLPNKIDTSDYTGVKFIDVACGALHCLALDTQGRVWSWGDNNWGQLGTDQTINRLPMPVELPVHVPITAVFAGGTHSGFLTHKFNMKSGWVQDTNDFKIHTKISFFETPS